MVLFERKLSHASIASFFEDFSNMLETGMSVTQALFLLKETTSEDILMHKLTLLEQELRKGSSLTDTLRRLNVFPWIVLVTLSAGERTGRLCESTRMLGTYFRHTHQVQSKIRQALIYPLVVFILLTGVMLFVSFRVIPQLKTLLPAEALESQTTQGVLMVSFFLQKYMWCLFVFALAVVGLGYIVFRRYGYQFQRWIYSWPVVGEVLKESKLALYLLNLSILLKSGVHLLKAVTDLNLLDRSPVAQHFAETRDYILGGASFWQAIEADPFFPRIISTTLRRAEEMVKLEEYCMSLAAFFNRRVTTKVDALIHLIQPSLLAFAGIFLVMIALAFILPIYGSLSTLAGGQ